VTEYAFGLLKENATSDEAKISQVFFFEEEAALRQLS